MYFIQSVMFIHAVWKDIKPDLWKLSQEDLEKSNRKKRFLLIVC